MHFIHTDVPDDTLAEGGVILAEGGVILAGNAKGELIANIAIIM